MGQPLLPPNLVANLQGPSLGLRRGARVAAVVALMFAGNGCDRSSPRMEFLSATPADGRPETCPDDAVDPGGPGGGPMAARCSYDPGSDAHLVQLRGSVLLEGGEGEMPVPAEGMRVEIRRDDTANGKVVGRSVTDAQGGFSVSLKGPPGAYNVRTISEETGETLAQRRFVVSENGRAVSGLDLLLPLDPALR